MMDFIYFLIALYIILWVNWKTWGKGFVDFYKLISRLLNSSTFLVLRKKMIKGSNYIIEIK
jgi:hypothetical protein